MSQESQVTRRQVGPVNLYDNPGVIFHMASFVGLQVEVRMSTGEIYEGIFNTISEKGDIVIQAAYRNFNHEEMPIHNLLESFEIQRESFFPKVVLKWKDVVVMTAKTVNVDRVVKDGFTDNAISGYPSNKPTVRELLPWDGGCSEENDVELEDGTEAANGWDVNDMFKTNADVFGVQSTFGNSLSEYTIPLVKRNTESYRHQELLASKLAEEIESDSNHFMRLQLENCDENETACSIKRSMTSNLESSPNVLSRNEKEKCEDLSEYEERNSQADSNDVTQAYGLNGYSQISPNEGTLAVHNLVNKVFNAEELNANVKKSSVNELNDGTFNIQNEVNALENNQGNSDLVKNVISVDELPDIVKKSTLNPNAKEFVLNPNAKCFTPRSMPSAILCSPSLVHNTSVVTSNPHPQIASSGPAMFSYYTHQHSTYNSITLSSYPAFQQSCGGGRKGQDVHPTMQVAAATGQPLLVSNPISNGNSVHYPPGHMISIPNAGHSSCSHPVQSVTSHHGQSVGPHHGQSITNHPGHTIGSHSGQPSTSHSVQTASTSLQVLSHPQIPYIVGPRVICSQPMNVETSYPVAYCDHLNVHNFDARNRMR